MHLAAVTPSMVYEALLALELRPELVLHDPVLAIRQGVTAEREQIQRFLSIVVAEPRDVPGGEDEIRLFAAAVLAIQRELRLRQENGQSNPLRMLSHW